MNTEELSIDEQEDIAQAMLNAMHEVLKELREKAGISETPHKFHRIMRADYITADKHHNLEAWERGYCGDRDSHVFDWDDDLTTDVAAFKAKFRAEALPVFNQARVSKRESIERELKSLTINLENLQGDIQ